MQTRKLGSSGLELTVIGLGTWAIGGGDWKFGWGDQDEREAIDAIVQAVECGINWIDTAAVYGAGQSELMVGKALQEIAPSRRPLIATKCGRVPLANGEIAKNLNRESVFAECEASLKRLQVDCIDLYQMHWPEPDEDIEEGWQALTDLQKSGKVRYIGVSNHSVQQLERLKPIHPVASLQPPYSMIARGIESDILPYCGREKIGVVVYSPMGKGMLTGAITRERVAQMTAKDHRTRDVRFQSPELEVNLAFVEQLGVIAKRLGWTLAELAITWTLRNPIVTSAIVGARRPSQIMETARAGSKVLASDAIADIDQAIASRESALRSLVKG